MTTMGHDGQDGETYGDYSVDDEDQVNSDDSLLGSDDDVENAMDRGYSPPERYSAGQGFGNTPFEEATGETLEQRIAQEEPEPDPYEQAETEAEQQADEADPDPEVGEVRAGRLVDPDEGAHTDVEKDLVGTDVGIDDAAASAEEAAVHVIEDDSILG